MYFPGDKKYTRSAVRRDGSNIDAFVVDPVRHFFEPRSVADAPGGAVLRYGGARRFDNVDGEVLELLPAGAEERSVFYFIDRDEHLVRRVVRGDSIDAATATSRTVLKRVRRNRGTIDDARFVWAVPPEASPLELPFSLKLPGRTRSLR